MDFAFDQIERLYEQNCFIDAYRQTEPMWKDPALLMTLGAEELVLGRRLAFRIGGFRTYRWITHHGARRFANHALFRGHWGHASHHRNLLDYLKDFYAQPQLGSGIAKYDCEWLCDHVEMLANVRDFPEANRILEIARAIHDGPEVASARATILLRQDRLEEAASISRDLWNAHVGRPAYARLLSNVLARQGRLDDVLEALGPASATGQSFEITMLMCWYLCARAERSSASEYRDYARRAHELSLRLPELSPLRDKDTSAAMASARTDCALILGDRATMLENAPHIRSGFYKQVVQNLQANPGGEFTLVPYRQAYQKHVTCLPTSIAAVLGAFGHEIDVDELAAAVTYDGTPTWRAMDWLESHGFAARVFVGNARIWRELLDSGVPFVLVDMRMSSCHAMAVIGCDDAQGTLIIHDPSSERWIQVLLDGLETDEAPFGPECMAVVPMERSQLLDCIPEESSRAIAAFSRCCKASETTGHQGCRPIVEELIAREPSSPFSRRIQALQAAWEGRLFQAIEQQEKLLAEFPNSTALLLDLVSSLARTRDTARIVRVQKDVVERGLLPSIQQNQTWRFPPSPYVAQYADYVGQHVEGSKKAVRLLNRAIYYEPGTANLYHVLGDVFLRHGHFEQARLPLRLAAVLDVTNDHYARGMCDALHRLGREDEGIQFLRWRVEELGNRIHGAYPWICLIAALEDYGRPDEAIAAMRDAQDSLKSDVVLQSFASQFWIRMGQWDEAEAALKVASANPGPVYLSAAVELHRAKGLWREALTLCEKWVAQDPQNMTARRELLWLLRCSKGTLAIEQVARGWMDEYANDELFEEVYYDVLKQSDSGQKLEEHLRRRIARNPLDAWAWRELGSVLICRLDQATPDRREALISELGQVLQQAERLSGDCPPRFALEADLLASTGEFPKAMESFFKALELDANYSYPYLRIWSLAGRLPLEQQRQILMRLEKCLLRQVGPIFSADSLLMAVADRLGIVDAEQAVGRWLQCRPKDPEIIYAQADLWLNCGRGHSDARRAVEILTTAVRHFVNHSGLRFLLARAHAVLLEEEAQLDAFNEILRRQPLNVQARYNVAMAHARRGNAETAIQIMEQGRKLSPGEGAPYLALADVLEFVGHPDMALQAALDGTQLVPERMELWDRAIHLMQQLGRFEQAIALSEKLTSLLPDGAYTWYLHAVSLSAGPTGSNCVAIEQALRRSLSLNAGLWSSVYRLSSLLMHQSRFEDAKAAVEQQMQFFEDASYHKAQLARILWIQGRRQEAIDAMVAMLAIWPKASWGWAELLDWLNHQEDWTTVRNVLQEVPPVMLSNADFRARRLMLLKKAGWDDQHINEAWQVLLDNFPANEDIHLNRFDVLLNEGRYQDARNVLEQVRRLYPNSEFVIARLVHVAIRENPEEALRHAMSIWTNLHELSSWSAAYAWEAIGNSHIAGQAVLNIYQWLMQGKPIRLSAVGGMLEHMHKTQFKRRFWDSLCGAGSTSQLEARMRALRKLLDVLETHRWDDGVCRAQVLVSLCELSRKQGWKYFSRHKSCREQTPVWAEGCRIFLDRTRKWLAQWRNHKGVEMYVVTNYTLSIRVDRGRAGWIARRKDLSEMADSAREALETLVYDSTPKYLACTLCEAQLRLNRYESFLSCMKQYRNLIQSQDTRFWMQGYEYLPCFLDHFEKLLTSADENEAVLASNRFITSPYARPPWAGKMWRRLLWKRVSFWSWLKYIFK